MVDLTDYSRKLELRNVFFKNAFILQKKLSNSYHNSYNITVASQRFLMTKINMNFYYFQRYFSFDSKKILNN